jgi:hypothetical protein
VKSLKQPLEVVEVVVMVLTFGGWEEGSWIDAKPGEKKPTNKI